MLKNYKWKARLAKKVRLKKKIPTYISIYGKNLFLKKIVRKKIQFNSSKKWKHIWVNII